MQEEDRKKNDMLFESVHKSAEYHEMLKMLSPLVKAISALDALRSSLRSCMMVLKNRMEKSARRMKIFSDDSRASLRALDYHARLFLHIGLT